VAIDGSTIAVQSTASNKKALGSPSNQHGEGVWPLARFVALAEVGTYMVFAAELGGYHGGETTLAAKVLDKLGAGMLCLVDRLFPG